MEGEDRGGHQPGHRGQHGGDGARGAHPDGVPQGDLVAAHVMEGLGNLGHLVRGNFPFIRASHDTGHVT